MIETIKEILTEFNPSSQYFSKILHHNLAFFMWSTKCFEYQIRIYHNLKSKKLPKLHLTWLQCSNTPWKSPIKIEYVMSIASRPFLSENSDYAFPQRNNRPHIWIWFEREDNFGQYYKFSLCYQCQKKKQKTKNHHHHHHKKRNTRIKTVLKGKKNV